MSHVLIVDDEPSICWGFREFLSEEGHEVSIAASAEEGLRMVGENKPAAIVLDVRLPGMDGLTAIEQFRRLVGDVPIIVITAFGNLETAVQAVKEGAFDYLPKPFDLDQASEVVGRAMRAAESKSNQSAAPPVEEVATSLIGSSPSMQEVFKQIALVAASDVPVLITGESGTGKELVARAIHFHSNREAGPFLPVCLAALSPGIVESELFGHVRGAFTGAAADRTGLLELASGGSVLLDEIADTSPGLQVKLLRALEQREVTPVGDSRSRPIDVRVIAATNRLLPEVIAAGEFREDLFFRLSVFQIQLPPLRERREDIADLARHFLRRCRPGDNGDVSVTDDVIAALCAREWTGNVRELRNAVEHAAVASRGNTIRPEDLPPPTIVARKTTDPVENVRATLSEWALVEAIAEGDDEELYERFLNVAEPPLLRAVLSACDNNRAQAARVLGMHRTTLRQKLRRHGIE
jgi:two-component system nitrogen regulation response regulator GlnG